MLQNIFLRWSNNRKIFKIIFLGNYICTRIPFIHPNYVNYHIRIYLTKDTFMCNTTDPWVYGFYSLAAESSINLRCTRSLFPGIRSPPGHYKGLGNAWCRLCHGNQHFYELLIPLRRFNENLEIPLCKAVVLLITFTCTESFGRIYEKCCVIFWFWNDCKVLHRELEGKWFQLR